jgi:hypothetical protein
MYFYMTGMILRINNGYFPEHHADYSSPNYPNCQLTATPQPRNASAKQASNKMFGNVNL